MSAALQQGKLLGHDKRREDGTNASRVVSVDALVQPIRDHEEFGRTNGQPHDGVTPRLAADIHERFAEVGDTLASVEDNLRQMWPADIADARAELHESQRVVSCPPAEMRAADGERQARRGRTWLGSEDDCARVSAHVTANRAALRSIPGGHP